MPTSRRPPYLFWGEEAARLRRNTIYFATLGFENSKRIGWFDVEENSVVFPLDANVPGNQGTAKERNRWRYVRAAKLGAPKKCVSLE